MMRYQTVITSALASLLVVPVFLGQSQITTLQDVLSGTKRAIEVLKGLEKRLQEDPVAALGLIFSATEEPKEDEAQRDRRLEDLRNEVNLLQMELDALQSPVLAGDGAVQSALGARLPGESQLVPQAGVTTGMDDAMRSFLREGPSRALPRPAETGGTRPSAPESRPATTGGETAYSADPLRHGISCYRAGRYAEAYELLAPLDDATSMYWQARTLERLERLDEAVTVMERAIAKGGEGFEQRRAETDLEFLRWKRDFVKSLPASKEGSTP